MLTRKKSNKKKEAETYFKNIQFGDKMAKTGTIFLNPAMIKKIINAEKNSPKLKSPKTMAILHSYSEKGMLFDFSHGNEFKTFKKDLGRIIEALRKVVFEIKNVKQKTWSERSTDFDQEAFQKGVLKIKEFKEKALGKSNKYKQWASAGAVTIKKKA